MLHRSYVYMCIHILYICITHAHIYIYDDVLHITYIYIYIHLRIMLYGLYAPHIYTYVVCTYICIYIFYVCIYIYIYILYSILIYISIVLSFAPSATAVWHCDRGRIMCGSNSARRGVFFKRWARQFVIRRFFYGGFFKFGGQFCGDFLLLFGVFLITFGVPGPRGPSRDPFLQHGRKREEKN